MYAKVEKSKENKSRAVASSVAQKNSNVKLVFSFVDNRPEAIAQRKLQTLANNSPRVNQLRGIQDKENKFSGEQEPIQMMSNFGDRGDLHQRTTAHNQLTLQSLNKRALNHQIHEHQAMANLNSDKFQLKAFTPWAYSAVEPVAQLHGPGFQHEEWVESEASHFDRHVNEWNYYYPDQNWDEHAVRAVARKIYDNAAQEDWNGLVLEVEWNNGFWVRLAWSFDNPGVVTCFVIETRAESEQRESRMARGLNFYSEGPAEQEPVVPGQPQPVFYNGIWWTPDHRYWFNQQLGQWVLYG